ncbi:MAG: SpoIID/LytB domain-containing protein [Chthonomonadetes bacterium]|nr:SpoIID/LytB domain-containing protein [Chthonomonadetes bacterium]
MRGKHTIALFFLLFALALPSLAQQAFNPEVRVWLTRWRNSSLHITCSARWQVVSGETQREIPAGETVLVERAGEQVALQIGDERLEAKEWNLQGEAPLSLSDAQGNNGRSYRGKIVVRVYRSRLQVLNVLPLEDYLLGVVPLEMPPGFPAEALKAQAVAARSWTVRNRFRHEADGADVCDGIHCQVYGGMNAEKESTTTAVRGTAGVILVNSDLPVDGVYTADCGGQPALGNGVEPPPADRDDAGRDYCADNPRHRWQVGFAFMEVWQAAGEQDSAQEPPKGEVDVQIAQSDAGGRVLNLRIRCGEVVREVSGVQLRSRLSLPSTLFSVRLDQGNMIVFEGSGSGHGKGLCQWGAAGRARAGQSMEQILQAYYPGASLATLSEVMWQWRKNQKGSSNR